MRQIAQEGGVRAVLPFDISVCRREACSHRNRAVRRGLKVHLGGFCINNMEGRKKGRKLSITVL